LLDPTVFGPSGSNTSRTTNFTWITLVDPTLFARPHEQTFSGQAWMAAPAQEFAPLTWSEPPEWLELSLDELGATFHQFIASQPFGSQQWLPQREPELRLPPLPPAQIFPEKSVLRLDGQLVRRELLSKPDLPSWPSGEVLSNSIVQVLVDPDGRPVSATLLPPGSGSREADERAVTLARAARFRPAPNTDPNHPLTGTDFGEMIFVWHIVPLPQTNATAPK
jgi:TonB family protein